MKPSIINYYKASSHLSYVQACTWDRSHKNVNLRSFFNIYFSWQVERFYLVQVICGPALPEKLNELGYRLLLWQNSAVHDCPIFLAYKIQALNDEKLSVIMGLSS